MRTRTRNTGFTERKRGKVKESDNSERFECVRVDDCPPPWPTARKYTPNFLPSPSLSLSLLNAHWSPPPWPIMPTPSRYATLRCTEPKNRN